MDPARTLTSASGRTVVVEDFGEHHMSAQHIRMRLAEPLLDVSEFHSTNGRASFSADGERLLISDSMLLLLLNLADGSAQSILANAGSYFGEPEFTERGVQASVRSAKGESLPQLELAFDDPAWRPGLGPAAAGLLPSVYLPFYYAKFP